MLRVKGAVVCKPPSIWFDGPEIVAPWLAALRLLRNHRDEIPNCLLLRN
jgi:hypothetical protein